jgi:hypothetical protein
MTRFAVLSTMLAVLLSTSTTRAEDAEPKTVSVGGVAFTVPATFEEKQPSVRIIHSEFAAPAAEGDASDGRFTVTVAGGSVEANIERWAGQFAGSPEPKVEKKTVGGVEVHVVDISGTFMDRRGPFAPAMELKDHRMLGAVLVNGNSQTFIKFTGPKATIEKWKPAFDEIIASVKKS